jgi:hypothetical protein
MTRFGQSEMVMDRNQPSLFTSQNGRDIAGTNRDKSGQFTAAEAPKSGQFGTPPLTGGVQCPAGTGLGMSRVPDVPLGKNTNRNDTRKEIFDAWLAECQAYDAAGRQDEVPPLPPGYLSSGPKLWREGATYSGKRWR